MILKMNKPVLIIALLICGALDAQSRAIDDLDNNSIEDERPRPRNPAPDGFRKVSMPPPEIMQKLGTPVEIVCEIGGSPAPTIQWVAGHESLPEMDSFEMNTLIESSPSEIVNVRSVHVIDHILSEPKVFTCVGRSGSKIVYGSTTVYPPTESKELIHFGNKALARPRKPIITFNHVTHIDFIGTNVVLPCKAYARPHAELFWMGKEGLITEQSNRFKILDSGELLISNLKWEDMGTYKCVARNSVGKAVAETFVYPLLRD
ncbi:neural/ectodermal development factor IMP-L2 isoform X1 [Eupeodes corollae]|uniref:neural/ectodermal development factor IMP-L2 isoform X1 n=1 Tax=Eupeodes corollae TaxID=290404 RepID=UPI002490D233|nr:neural/ectodermal development factor IMP-L2 isoform X1 [Eupeodes corollae]